MGEVLLYSESSILPSTVGAKRVRPRGNTYSLIGAAPQSVFFDIQPCFTTTLSRSDDELTHAEPHTNAHQVIYGMEARIEFTTNLCGTSLSRSTLLIKRVMNTVLRLHLPHVYGEPILFAASTDC